MTSLKLTDFRNLLTMRLFVLVFLFVNIVALIFIPITPDEVSRQGLAAKWVETGQYDFSWPPMLMLINAFIELIGGGTYQTRIFFLAIEFYLFWKIHLKVKFTPNIPSLFVLPYFALVLSTGSPQGLMIGLLPLLIFSIRESKLNEIYFISILLYLLNPTCTLILLISAFFSCLLHHKEIGWNFLIATLYSIISLVVFSYVVYLNTGVFMPTLTNNGPLNLFLGNNPHPMSYRGVAYGQEWVEYTSVQYFSVITEFLTKQPHQFLENYSLKIIFWLAPFDYFRSGLGSSVQYILFFYVGLTQLIIYSALFKFYKNNRGTDIKIALLIFITAWLIYAIFFVKLRFRIPFDALIYIIPHLIYRPKTLSKS